MTLEYLLNELCELGIRHNLVNYTAAGGSIYSLNSETIDSYPFFFFSPTEDIRVEKNFTTYGITVFYVDRLIGDNMNDTQVYSNGTLAIQNLMRQVKAMDGIVGVEDYSIRVFSETEKMADKVNGAYARVNITTLNSYNCSIYFDETGAPMGTYVPDVIKDTSVLDALASKEWVKRFLAGISVSGITPEEFEEILSDYVLEKNFSTINGEKITNRKKFTLVDQSAYTQDIQNIYQAISGATPEDYSAMQEQVSANTEDIAEIKDSLSALTPSDYDEVRQQVSANTENISTLSAFTENVVSSLTEQREIIEQLQESDSLVFIIDNNSTQADINALVEAVLDTGNTQWGKITLFYKTNTYSDGGYVVLRPYYRYRPRTDYEVYFKGVVANNAKVISLFLVGFSRNTMQQSVDRRDYDMSKYVPNNEFRTINGQQIYGSGYGDFSLVNSIENTVTGIWSGTQAAYDAIQEKSPTTLYVING